MNHAVELYGALVLCTAVYMYAWIERRRSRKGHERFMRAFERCKELLK